MRPRLSPPIRPGSSLLVALAASLTLAACGGGDGTSTETKTPQLANMTIEQKLDTLSELNTRLLTLAGTDKQGLPFAVSSATWQSSDTTIATVATNGEVTGVRPGSATITAKSGAVSTQIALRIVAVPVRDVTVSLVGGVAGDTLLVGTSATLVAEARDVAGRLLRDRQVSVSVADPSKATLSGGKLSGVAVGLADIVATSDSIVRHRNVVIRPPFAAKLAIKMLDPRKLGDTTWAGLRDSVLVTFTDSAGQALAPSAFRPVSYSTDNASIATVDPYGKVSFLAAGTATIRATGDKLVAAKQVVAVRAPVTTIVAAPDTIRVAPGAVSQIRPVLVDGGGLRATSLTGHTLSFQSLTPSIATVDGQGNVTGVANGKGEIRVTSDRGTATVPVQVSAAGGSDAFHITLRFVGPKPEPFVVDAFNAAVKRWEGVIRLSTGTYTDTLTQALVKTGECDNDPPNTPGQVEQITDIVIYARIDSIDGPSSILGQAGPCYIKQLPSRRFMSTVGSMVFDSADMNLMQTRGLLTNVITHEMGHVLGIGTMWSAALNNGVALAVGITPRSIPTSYVGAGGMAASAGMGFTGFSIGTSGDPTLDRALIEDTGGAGTAGSHWRRSVYGNELMNGFAGSGPQPLSLLTVLAIGDLGFSVNTAAAETWGSFLFSTPSASLGRLPELFAQTPTPWGERLVTPRFGTTLGGRRVRLSPTDAQ
jgi:uncharacterized protein YjdB